MVFVIEILPKTDLRDSVSVEMTFLIVDVLVKTPCNKWCPKYITAQI